MMKFGRLVCFTKLQEKSRKDVIANLHQIPEVKEIQCVSGPYDILVKVEAPTIDELMRQLHGKFEKSKMSGLLTLSR